MPLPYGYNAFSPSRGSISSTPFGRRDSGVYALVYNAQVEHAYRLRFYNAAWKFYHGIHWSYLRPEDEAYVTYNLVKKFVDKHVNFLMSKGIQISIPDDPTTSANETKERDFIKRAVDDVWKKNNRPVTLREIAQTGSITGDVFVRISLEREDPRYPQPYPKIEVLPSEYVFPFTAGPTGVERKRVDSILVIYPQYSLQHRQDRRPYKLSDHRRSTELYAERWYPDRVEIFQNSAQPTSVVANPYGEIPIVHIKNQVIANELFGKSDIGDVLSMQEELNEKATDISDVINYHGSPLTLVYGARISELERGANKMWGIPSGEVKVENLELKGDLTASMAYLNFIKRGMHELAGVPESTLGTVERGVNDESAAARALQYMPLTEVRDQKIPLYAEGIEQINRLIIKTLEIADPEFQQQFERLPVSYKNYLTAVKFNEALPRDESVKLANNQLRLEMGITTRKHILQEEGKSRGEIDEILKESVRQRSEDANIEFSIGQNFDEPQERSGNPNPVRPNPDVQSERRSTTVETDAFAGTRGDG